jgi:hypothetical protein
MPITGLRFPNVMVREDDQQLPSFWDDPWLRKWDLWSHVDESHVAQAIRCGREADVQGAD